MSNSSQSSSGFRYIKVRPYLLKELALFYEVDPRILKKWIMAFKDELGPKIGYYYQIHQVLIIFKKIQLPHNIIVSDDYEE